MYNNHVGEKRAKFGAPIKTRKSENAKAKALAESNSQLTPRLAATSHGPPNGIQHVETVAHSEKQGRGQFTDRGFLSPSEFPDHEDFEDNGYEAQNFGVSVDDDGWGCHTTMGASVAGGRVQQHHPLGEESNHYVQSQYSQSQVPAHFNPDSSPDIHSTADAPSRNLLRKTNLHRQHRASPKSHRP